MNRIIILVLVLIITGSNLFAEKKLPVIRANSKMVDVRAGNSFHKGDWKISPEAKPDIYTTSLIGEKITFYTDLDSISVKINSKTKKMLLMCCKFWKVQTVYTLKTFDNSSFMVSGTGQAFYFTVNIGVSFKFQIRVIATEGGDRGGV